MIKLINKVTGGSMWVDDNRVDEYIAAGHKKPAVISKEPAKPVKATADKPTKTRAKKDGNSK